MYIVSFIRLKDVRARIFYLTNSFHAFASVWQWVTHVTNAKTLRATNFVSDVKCVEKSTPILKNRPLLVNVALTVQELKNIENDRFTGDP